MGIPASCPGPASHKDPHPIPPGHQHLVLGCPLHRLLLTHLGSDGLQGFPGGASGKEPTCSCRRHKRLGFDLWVGKIPWRRKWHTRSLLHMAPPSHMDSFLTPMGPSLTRAPTPCESLLLTLVNSALLLWALLRCGGLLGSTSLHPVWTKFSGKGKTAHSCGLLLYPSISIL